MQTFMHHGVQDPYTNEDFWLHGLPDPGQNADSWFDGIQDRVKMLINIYIIMDAAPVFNTNSHPRQFLD